MDVHLVLSVTLLCMLIVAPVFTGVVVVTIAGILWYLESL